MSLYCARVKLQNLAENKLEGLRGEYTQFEVICSVLEYLPLPSDIREDYHNPYIDKEEQEVKWEAEELTLSCNDGDKVFKRIKFLTPANLLTGNLIVIYDARLNLFGIWREEEWQRRDKETTSITIRTSDYQEINLTKLEIDNSVERMKRLDKESKLLGKKNLGKRVMELWTCLKPELKVELNRVKTKQKENETLKEEIESLKAEVKKVEDLKETINSLENDKERLKWSSEHFHNLLIASKEEVIKIQEMFEKLKDDNVENNIENPYCVMIIDNFLKYALNRTDEMPRSFDQEYESYNLWEEKRQKFLQKKY